jgi:hypothetical protein
MGDIIAFTDADCNPDPDWIEKGVSALLKAPNCGLLGGRVDTVPANPRRPNAVELYDIKMGLVQKDYIEKHRFGATANVFTFKEVFSRVGFFNDTVKSGGDFEWGQRVSAHGYRLSYADDVRVTHAARSSFAGLYRRVARIMGGLHDFNKDRRGPRIHYDALGKSLFLDLLPPVRTSIRVLQDADIRHFTDRLRIIAVMFFVQYAQAYELLRLRLGWSAKR